MDKRQKQKKRVHFQEHVTVHEYDPDIDYITFSMTNSLNEGRMITRLQGKLARSSKMPLQDIKEAASVLKDLEANISSMRKEMDKLIKLWPDKTVQKSNLANN